MNTDKKREDIRQKNGVKKMKKGNIYKEVKRRKPERERQG